MSFTSALPANIGKLASALPTYDVTYLVETLWLLRGVDDWAQLVTTIYLDRTVYDAVLQSDQELFIKPVYEWIEAIESLAAKQYATYSLPFLASQPANMVLLCFHIPAALDVASIGEIGFLSMCSIDLLSVSEIVMQSLFSYDWTAYTELAAFYRESSDRIGLLEQSEWWESVLPLIRLVEDYTYVIVPEDHNIPARYHRSMPRFASIILSRVLELARAIPLRIGDYVLEEYRRAIMETEQVAGRLRTVYSERETIERGLPITLSRIMTSDINDRVLCWQLQLHLLSKVFEVLAMMCNRIAYYMEKEKGRKWECAHLYNALYYLDLATMYAAQMRYVKAGDIMTAAIHNIHANAWNNVVWGLYYFVRTYWSVMDALETLRSYRQWGYDSAKRGRHPFKGPFYPLVIYLVAPEYWLEMDFGSVAVSYAGTVYVPFNWYPGLGICSIKGGTFAVVKAEDYVLGSPCMIRPPWYHRVVVFGDSSGNIYAIHPAGPIFWTYEAPSGIFPCITCWNDEILYAGMDPFPQGEITIGAIVAIKHDGTPLWTCYVDGATYAAIAVHENGNVYALMDEAVRKVDKQEIVIPGRLFSFTKEGYLRWQYIGPSAQALGVTVDDNGVAYAGGKDPHFWAINPDGTLKFRLDLNTKCLSQPCIDEDGYVYILDWDGVFHKISPNGEIIWSVETDEYENAVVPCVDAKGDIYFTSAWFKIYLYCISSDGYIRWRIRWSDWYVFFWYQSGPPAIPFEDTLVTICTDIGATVYQSGFELGLDYYGQVLANAANTSESPGVGPDVPFSISVWYEGALGAAWISPILTVDFNGFLYYVYNTADNYAYLHIRLDNGGTIAQSFLGDAVPPDRIYAPALSLYTRSPYGIQPFIYVLGFDSPDRVYLSVYTGLGSEIYYDSVRVSMLELCFSPKTVDKTTMHVVLTDRSGEKYLERYDLFLYLIWSSRLYELDGYPIHAPAFDKNGTAYLQGAANECIAIGSNGEEKWVALLPDTGLKAVTVVNDDAIAFPRDDGRVYILSSTGELKCTVEADNAVWAIAASKGTYIYVCSSDGSLRCYNERGELMWGYVLPGVPEHPPIVNNQGNIYVAIPSSFENLIYVSKEGEKKWAADLPVIPAGQPIIGSGLSLYIVGKYGQIYTVVKVSQA